MMQTKENPAPMAVGNGANENTSQANYSTGSGCGAAVFPMYATIRADRPTRFISLSDVASMAKNPTVKPKTDAAAITPYKAEAKTKQAALEAEYHALVSDHDDDDMAAEQIRAVYDQWHMGYLAFTSASHEQDKGGITAKRWKVLIPLSRPVGYERFKVLSEGLMLLNRTDKAQTRSQQVFFAPNRIAHDAPFDYIDETGLDFLDPLDYEHRFIKACEAAYEAEARRQEDGSKHTPPARLPTPADGGVIGAFNAAYHPGQILERNGYTKAGKRWRCPESTSGVPGVVLLEDSDPPRVYTHHGADPLANGHSHDAFSVFTILEHDGDARAATKAAAAPEFDALPAAIDSSDDSHPDLSHDELALQLGTIGGWNQRARYVAAWDRWLFWTGTRWEIDARLRHMTEARVFLRKVAHDLERWARKQAGKCHDEAQAEKVQKWARNEAKTLRQAGTRASVESTARSNPELSASVEQWDGNLDLLGTPGGTVDLSTGAMRPADSRDYITKHTSIEPVRGEPWLWLEFLHTAMQGDVQMVAFLKRLAGYMLTGHTSEHKLPFAFGPGGNGKSVFANTLHSIMSDYAARAPAEAFLSSKGERHPTDLAGLQGARLVVGSELPAGRAWNESVIKDLTGGDPITARFMRQDFFTYTPQFTLLIVGNHQPSIGAVDEAMRRRLLLIPFTATIPEDKKDPELEAKLRQEHGEILHWMIEGAVEWYKHGLMVPESVKAATDDYLEAEDMLGQFIADELRSDPRADASSSAVYDRHRDWCRAQGMREWSQRALSQALRERGITIKKERDGRKLKGWRLLSASESDTAAPDWKAWR